MRIALLGDVSLTGMFDAVQTNEVFSRIEPIKQLVADCDYVICNLESPLTGRTKTLVCKGAYLRSDPCNVKVLKSMGITHVTLANNHVFDYGKRAARETISILDTHGIQYCGLNTEPLLLVVGEDRALLDGFCCYSANGVYYGNKPLSIQTLDYNNLHSFFEKAVAKHCLPIASVHFGVERVHYPAQEHLNLFHSFAEKYPFVLHGNHTHSIQGLEKYRDSLLIYSQGNLLFDDVLSTSIGAPVRQNSETRKTYIVKMDVSGNVVMNHEIVAIQFDENGYPCVSSAVDEELLRYCDIVVHHQDQMGSLRTEELKAAETTRAPRNIGFFMRRMNPKYMGAYVNGKIHGKKYAKIFRPYLNMK